MDDVTLQALKDSIAKWEKNSTNPRVNEVLIGVEYCPLCVLFHDSWCEGCPVEKQSGQVQCVGTPFTQAAEKLFKAWDGKIPPEQFHEAARAEVDFLKSLLPEAQS